LICLQGQEKYVRIPEITKFKPNFVKIETIKVMWLNPKKKVS